ncbi:MAG: hypothetical protein K0Q76_1997 [Panacagrimonas sp.]|jgi:hypothetical protein|nr:hypothetical protein [Panacagrimonas sp.]MCC2656889.1 hypothetical protein [Panacagrimonas sp.]
MTRIRWFRHRVNDRLVVHTGRVGATEAWVYAYTLDERSVENPDDLFPSATQAFDEALLDAHATLSLGRVRAVSTDAHHGPHRRPTDA